MNYIFLIILIIQNVHFLFKNMLLLYHKLSLINLIKLNAICGLICYSVN